MQEATSLGQAKTASWGRQEPITTTERGISGRFFHGWIVLLSIGLLIGVWGAATLLVKGHGATGTNQQIPWGILVPGYLFFSALSTGCVIVVSGGYALGVQGLALVMKRAVFLAIVTFLAGGILVILDLGSPQTAVHMLFSTNFGSPMRGMSLVYALYFFLLLIEFVLISRGSTRNLRTASVFTALAAVLTSSTLGAIFGFASAKTYFGGAFAPVYFTLLTVVMGTALVLLVSILHHKFTKTPVSPEFAKLASGLGKFLGVLVSLAAFFIAWKILSGVGSAVDTTALGYQYTLSSWWYWVFVIIIGLAIPMALLLNAKTRGLKTMAIASAMVLTGMFAARFEHTIGGQIVPVQQNLQHPGFSSSYTPTFVEIAVVILAFTVAASLYTFGARKLGLGKAVDHR